MEEIRKDLAMAGSLVIVSLLALWRIRTTQPLTAVPGDVITFATLPTLYAGSLVILTGVLIAVSFAKLFWKHGPDTSGAAALTALPEAPAGSPKPGPAVLKTGATVLLLLGYVSLLGVVHFMLLSGAFLFAMFFVFGQRSILRNVRVAVGGAALLHVLFVTILRLRL